MKATSFDWSIPVKWLAWLSLLAAFILGQIAHKPDYHVLLQDALPTLTFSEAPSKLRNIAVFDVESNVDSTEPNAPHRLLVNQVDGFAGPLSVVVTLHGARIHQVQLLDHVETPPYIERLKKRFYFRQFRNQPLTNNFILDDDLDGYSGATITARAVSQAVRESVHGYAQAELNLPPTWAQASWTVGANELVMLVLVLASLYISSKHAKRNPVTTWLKTALPFAALVFVGFYVNASVSLSSLGSIVMGYVPGFRQYPLWWILMGGIGLGLLLLGSNIYCKKLCAFYTVQQLLSKISGLDLKLTPKVAKHMRTVVLFLIWSSLLLIFLSRHPALGSYEPFSMMFALEGMGLQWYILPLSLVGAFFIRDFWCRYFCPVGLVLNEAVRVRRKALSTVTSKVSLQGAGRQRKPLTQGRLGERSNG